MISMTKSRYILELEVNLLKQCLGRMLLQETTAFKEQVTKEEEDIKQELEALETKMAQLNTVRMAGMDGLNRFPDF